LGFEFCELLFVLLEARIGGINVVVGTCDSEYTWDRIIGDIKEVYIGLNIAGPCDIKNN